MAGESQGIGGMGTTLAGSITGTIGNVQKINIDGFDVGEIDVTVMSSPGKWREFVAGLKDAKQLTIDCLYHKDSMDDIIAAIGGTNETWTITFPDGSTYVQKGFIKGCSTAIPHDDKISQSLTIRLIGLPVFMPSHS